MTGDNHTQRIAAVREAVQAQSRSISNADMVGPAGPHCRALRARTNEIARLLGLAQGGENV